MSTDQSHIILVSGGKGGVGKSVFAVNLALSIGKEERKKVLLLDLDLKSCGDLNLLLNSKTQKNLKDLFDFSGILNESAVSQFVTKHPLGLDFIPSVTEKGSTEFVFSHFQRQLQVLSKIYPYIVIDLGSELNDDLLQLTEIASAILLLSTPESLVVKRTGKILTDFLSYSIPRALFQLVLNKEGQLGMNLSMIQSHLKINPLGGIPIEDRLVHLSIQNRSPFVLSQPNHVLSQSYLNLFRKLKLQLTQLKSLSRPKVKKVASFDQINESANTKLTGDNFLKDQIHKILIKEMDLKKDYNKVRGDAKKEEELRKTTQQSISGILERINPSLDTIHRKKIIKEVLNEALALGPLEELLEDPSVTEIMVNGCDQIYVEKNGKLTLSSVSITSNVHLKNIIERIVTPLGRRIDEKTPYVDARLKDGSRVNAVIEPLSIDGPAITIRKFSKDRITIKDYTNRFASLTAEMGVFLKICVENGLNVVISGGTGSGKTTLLNVLSSFIPSNERIITVEDAAELQLKQEHVVRLETRPENMEGEGEVSIRDLIKNALRMRPDRIVVGECRDGAALDMLSAMNTGHDGSMTTVHANTPRESISRLETLCMMAGMDLPVKAIREQIAGAVHLIVQIGRLSDGSRKVKSITEVVGMQGETVTLQEIFRFKETGFDADRRIQGEFQAMGIIPSFIEELERKGIQIPRNLFTTSKVDSLQQKSAVKKEAFHKKAKVFPKNFKKPPFKKVGGS